MLAAAYDFTDFTVVPSTRRKSGALDCKILLDAAHMTVQAPLSMIYLLRWFEPTLNSSTLLVCFAFWVTLLWPSPLFCFSFA